MEKNLPGLHDGSSGVKKTNIWLLQPLKGEVAVITVLFKLVFIGFASTFALFFLIITLSLALTPQTERAVEIAEHRVVSQVLGASTGASTTNESFFAGVIRTIFSPIGRINQWLIQTSDKNTTEIANPLTTKEINEIFEEDDSGNIIVKKKLILLESLAVESLAPINWDEIKGTPSFLSSINSVLGAAGNIKLLEGDNITITNDKTKNTITISSTGTATVTGNVAVNLTAGTGISISNDVITNTNLGSSQSIFKKVAVSGQSTVVADSNNDTLTFAAGAGIAITTSASADRVTIASTSSGVAFDAVTAGTNANALVIGTGGSLSVTGSGTIAATSVPATGITGSLTDGQVSNTLTIDGTGSVTFGALTTYPAACAANTAITALADSPTCSAFWSSGNDGSGSTLDADLLDGSDSTAFSPVAGSGSITTVGALTSGSIATGFGTISTSNTITGTTLNGTTGINTGAGAGTQRIDSSGNLLNIGNITLTGNISDSNSAVNITDDLFVAGTATAQVLNNDFSTDITLIKADLSQLSPSATQSNTFIGVHSYALPVINDDLSGSDFNLFRSEALTAGSPGGGTLGTFRFYDTSYNTYDHAAYTGSVTITDFSGLYVSDPDLSNTVTTGDTTITNAYGIYIEDFTAGEGTFSNTPIAIYQAGTDDYNILAGQTRIGSTANPAAGIELDVAGDIQFSGSLTGSSGANTYSFASTATTGDMFYINGVAAIKTSGSTLNAIGVSNPGGNTIPLFQFNPYNINTSAEGGDTINGLYVHWTQGGIWDAQTATENIVNVTLDAMFAAKTDNAITAGLLIHNNDTATGNQLVITDGIKFSAAVAETTAFTNYINSTNFQVTSAGAITAGITTSTHTLTGMLCVKNVTACPAQSAGRLYVDTAGTAGDDPGDVFDIAEYFPSSEDVQPGDVLTIDDSNSKTVKKASSAYDEKLIGIVSSTPAAVIEEGFFSIGGDLKQFNPRKPYVALAGRVPVKVSTENGDIAPGDPLTSSSTAGVAMKATKSGPIVGKALEGYSGPPAGGGVGKIMVFVNTSWYVEPLGDVSSRLSDVSQIDLETLTAGTINTQVLFIGERKLDMAPDGTLVVDGSVNILGDLTLEGDLKVAGEISAKKVNVSDEAAGSSTIKKGKTKIFIETTLITDKSQVLITLNTLTQKAIAVTEKKPDEGFTVEISVPETKDINLDWFIVN